MLPTRTFEPEPEPEPAPEPAWHERDSFGGRVPAPDESDAEKTSIFTSYQQSERGSLFEGEAQPSLSDRLEGEVEPERGSLFEAESYDSGSGSLFADGERGEPYQDASHGAVYGDVEHEYEHGATYGDAEHQSAYSSDIEHENAYESEHGGVVYGETEHEDEGHAAYGSESEHGSLFESEPQQYEPEQSYGSHAAVEEPPAYAFGADTATPDDDETPAEATAVLPRRQPRSTPPSSFEPPRPSMRSVERREPVADEGGRSGSLFEPVVRPNTGGAHSAPEPEPAAPPPARTHVGDSAVPPGPFGPGSAMPRPGGGRPSDEFTVKASVTALRYCTEDSPQFGRMVAEVWFRSVADAERVGFRPLH